MPRLVLSLLLLAACSSAEDRAAKERIFSPEDPPRVLRAAAEPLDAAGLARDAALVRRVLEIPAQEALHRLGPHVQKATVSFRWTRPPGATAPTEGEGNAEVKLAEERTVAVAKNGDFLVRIENDGRQGMEWYRVAGVSYARSRYAKIRERRRDRGSSEHVLRDGYAALAAFERVMQGAVSLRDPVKVTHEGRPALRYTAVLGEARPDPGAAKLPPVEFARGGPDADTKRRLEAAQKGVPADVSGTVTVDEATAVPVQARLQGSLAVNGEAGRSMLELVVDLAVTGVGRDPGIEVPEHVPDEPRRPGVVATLDAYGIPRATGEGGSGGAHTGEVPPEPDAE